MPCLREWSDDIPRKKKGDPTYRRTLFLVRIVSCAQHCRRESIPKKALTLCTHMYPPTPLLSCLETELTHALKKHEPELLPASQLRMYIELKSIEIRTEVQQESSTTEGTEDPEAGNGESQNPLEAGWNHEPLDYTRSRGEGRLEYGCPYSREKGVTFNVRIYMHSRGSDMLAVHRGRTASGSSTLTVFVIDHSNGVSRGYVRGMDTQRQCLLFVRFGRAKQVH